MQIKQFEAKDMTEALRLIKKEFGPDAVILSARDMQTRGGVLGMLKRPGVEVTAAIDVPLESASRPPSPPSESPADQSPDSGEHRMGILSGGPLHGYLRHIEPENTGRTGSLPPPPDLNSQGLLDQGVEPALIEEIRNRCGRNTRQLRDYRLNLERFLKSKQISEFSGRASAAGNRILTFLGPTGVGKTTTIAKLAAAQVHHNGGSIGLITLDNERIGAVEHLSIYARIIGCPLEAPTGRKEFHAAIRKFASKDLILIDTPGTGPTDSRRRQELKLQLETAETGDHLLVISATTRDREMEKTVQAFKGIGIDGLVFTKMDECCTLGGILNLLGRHPLPLAYFAAGQQVPEDIETASVRKLVNILMGTGNLKASRPGAERNAVFHGEGLPDHAPFQANRHSDIFHRAECKSAQQIHPKNRIWFDSVEKAVKRRFKPCKICLSDRTEMAEAFSLVDISAARKVG